MDSDDVLTKSALEDMFTQAEKFQAEVLICDRYYTSSGIGQEFFNNVKLVGNNKIQTPTPLPYDIIVRLNTMEFSFLYTQPWLKFSLRDFLIQNNLKFHSMPREDDLWHLQLALTAKNYLLIPNACYIARDVENSRSVKVGEDIEKYIHYWLGRSMFGLKILDKFISKMDFFIANPDIKLILLNNWVAVDLDISDKAFGNMSANNIYKIFMKNFREYFGDNSELMAQIFINCIMLNKNLHIANQKITELDKKNL